MQTLFCCVLYCQKYWWWNVTNFQKNLVSDSLKYGRNGNVVLPWQPRNWCRFSGLKMYRCMVLYNISEKNQFLRLPIFHSYGKYFGPYRESVLKLFSRTTGPGKLRFIWKLPDIEKIQVCSSHDPRGYDGATIGDQSLTYDYIGKIFKCHLLKNHWARKAEIYMEASWYSGNSNLFKSWPPGGTMGPQ